MDNCLEHSKVMSMLDRGKERLDHHDSAIEELTKISERLTIIEGNNSEVLKKQDERIKDVELQPASTFREIKMVLISAAIGALFGAMPQIINLIR